MAFDIPGNSPFSFANIPFGIYSTHSDPQPRCCSRLGDYIVDLPKAAAAGLISTPSSIVSQTSLNAFAAQGNAAVAAVREEIIAAFSKASDAALACLVPLSTRTGSNRPAGEDVKMHLPFATRDYTDFLCSRVHTLNMRRIFGGGTDLDPGFMRNPIAYHGRASSLLISGTPIRRPWGTTFDPRTKEFGFAPSGKLDFEVEMGYYISKSSTLGDRIVLGDAQDYIFGIVLVNDWSARDHQPLEMTGLGPFNAKNFATSVSPWVITLAALQNHIVPGPEAGENLAPHLISHGGDRGAGRWFDVQIEASVNGTVLSKPNLKAMQYTPEQMVAHHSLAGCPMNVGDLLATGTISSSQENAGCLCEKTENGQKAYELADGQNRTYLLDGDSVKFTAWAGGEGSGIGWGEVEGTILEARPL